MKIIYIILTVLFFLPGLALAGSLDIEFESEPLFSDANFLPGQSVSRWVKVTNNTAGPQRIAAEAINVDNNSRLGDALNIEIKKGGNQIYNSSLSQFFTTGEIFLSELANGDQAQYDFEISFFSGSSNSFQGKETGFDILVGIQGQEGGISPGGGSGGGGYLPPGLIITNEAVVEKDETTATITWLTSYNATSRVVYGVLPGVFDLTKLPDYGYEFSTEEKDEPASSNGVTSHTVQIAGLNPATTYYFRCISHGSFAVSAEHSFTTLASSKIAPAEADRETPEEQLQEGEVKGVYTETKKDGETSAPAPAFAPAVATGENNNKISLPGLKAAIGDALAGFRYFCWILLAAIIILIALFFYSIKKGKIEKNKIWWILPFLTIILLIAYYFYCPYAKIIIPAVILISLIAYIGVMKNAKGS